MLNRIKRLEKLEEAVSTGRMPILEVSYSQEGGKYYKTSSNGTVWIKREIDPHRELFEADYKGVIVEQHGIKNDKAIEIVGVSRVDDQDVVIYKETFNGQTKALLKDGIAY